MILEERPAPIWRDVAKAALCTLATVTVTQLVEYAFARWKAKREERDR